ncbi:hypothetical protein [Prochlorococcus sp. MIT 1201]
MSAFLKGSSTPFPRHSLLAGKSPSLVAALSIVQMAVLSDDA